MRLVASSSGALVLACRTAPAIAIAAATLGGLSGLAAAPSAWMLKNLLDTLADGGSAPTEVVALAIGSSLLVAGSAAFAYLAGIFETELSGRVQVATQTRLLAACASYDGTAFLDDPARHEELNLARRGAHEAPPALATLLVTVVSSVASVASFAVLLAASWPWMLAAVLLTSVPMALLQRRASRAMLDAAQQSAASYRWVDYFSGLFTTPSSARETRLFGTAAILLDRHAQQLASATRAETLERRRSASAQASFTLFSGVVAATGAGVVAAGVAAGNATAGDFILFTTAVAALQRVTVTLLGLAGTAVVAANVYAAFDAFVTTAESSAPHRGRALPEAPPLTRAIEFCGVTFRYPGATAAALSDFSARFEVGATYAITGENGSGKSTVTRLLMRFYEPDLGTILWDGVDINCYSAESLRRRMSGVMQDFVRYELSAVDNVILGADIGSTAFCRIEDALAAVNMAETVAILPQGHATVLSPTRTDDAANRGSYLSGGQWQRMAIARALAKGPVDVLVLDEPDAALDSDGVEALARTAQAAVGTGHTKLTLLVSHGAATVRHADHVIRLSHGRVAAIRSAEHAAGSELTAQP